MKYFFCALLSLVILQSVALVMVPNYVHANHCGALVTHPGGNEFVCPTNTGGNPAPTAQTQFVPLVGIPGLQLDGNQDFGDYVNALYILAISIAAFLAVVRIIIAGVNYMMSDVVTTKGEAKKQIQGALVGLLIVLAAVLILNTINPQLTNLDVFGRAEQISGSSGVFDLLYPAGVVPTGVNDTLDIKNSTPEQIAQAIVSCIGINNTNGNVWSYSTDSFGRVIGQCTRDDGSGIGSTGTVITSPESATVMRDTCYSLQRPYLESQTTFNNQSVTVGRCGDACTPQEQFSLQQNRCVAYTDINPTPNIYTCAQPTDLFNNPACTDVTVTIGGERFTFTKLSDSTVSLDCNSVEIGSAYESICLQICSTGGGSLNAQNICTLTSL